MPDTLRKAVKKTLQSDSTVIINSLLHVNASSEKMSDEEKIAAGLLALVDGPLKVTYGLLMISSGILLAPIPCVVATVSTKETTDSHGKRAEVTALGVSFRMPKSPFQYIRKETHHDGHGYYETIVKKDWAAKPTIRIIDPDGKLPNQIDADHQEIQVKTTVTGLNLATTGLGRVCIGAIDPVTGTAKATFFGAKKLFSSNESHRHYNQMSDEHDMLITKP